MNQQHIINRFIRYAKINTQSNPDSVSTPSSDNQWDLANILAEELKAIGMQDVEIDEHAYIMATLPSNVDYDLPTIGFISHFDTSPDFTAKNVNPQFIASYNGNDIVLNKELGIVLSPNDFKELLNYKGQPLITTDGTTLLGADDKAGICEIISAMEHLINNPEIKHGTIRVGFTPDEEIGKGAHKFDVKKFNADWAYTMDGSQIGELEYENFNAADAKISISGKMIHPGYAKGKMINALYIATQFAQSLPANETPETTEGHEGFYHLYNISGNPDHAVLKYIIRDHDRVTFESRKQSLIALVNQFNSKFKKDRIEISIVDQYYNMKEKIEPVIHIVDLAKKAMINLNIKPIIRPIRGGTDGSQLSFKGLPCPNIFAGGHNFHGQYEYLPVNSMIKATEVICEIARLSAVIYKP